MEGNDIFIFIALASVVAPIVLYGVASGGGCWASVSTYAFATNSRRRYGVEACVSLEGATTLIDDVATSVVFAALPPAEQPLLAGAAHRALVAAAALSALPIVVTVMFQVLASRSRFCRERVPERFFTACLAACFASATAGGAAAYATGAAFLDAYPLTAHGAQLRVPDGQTKPFDFGPARNETAAALAGNVVMLAFFLMGLWFNFDTPDPPVAVDTPDPPVAVVHAGPRAVTTLDYYNVTSREAAVPGVRSAAAAAAAESGWASRAAAARAAAGAPAKGADELVTTTSPAGRRRRPRAGGRGLSRRDERRMRLR